MLVTVVEVREGGEVRPVPSSVRLRVLQRCPEGWRDALQFVDPVGQRGREVFGVAANGKPGPVSIGGRVAANVDGESVADVIKRGAQVVDAFADRDIEPVGGRGIEHTKAKTLLACLDVAIKEQLAWVTFAPPLDRILYRGQVLVSPVELGLVGRCHALSVEDDGGQAARRTAHGRPIVARVPPTVAA
jgi:hypothetical protein